MVEEENKKAIQQELEEVQSKIQELKPSFRDLKKVKEDFYVEGEKYNEKIEQLYNEIKEIEKEKNLDQINEDLNFYLDEEKKLKAKLEDLEKQEEVSQDSSKRPQIKTYSVGKTKAKIKHLENKLQTEVLNIQQESGIVSQIKELKDKISNFEESADVNPKKIGFLRTKYQRQLSAVERKIKSTYKKIRLISKDKKKRYKEIDDLKAKRKEAFDKFREEKKKYSEVSKELRGYFRREEELLEEITGKPSRKKSRVAEKSDMEDKLKEGGTFTTEDLLYFQSLEK